MRTFPFFLAVIALSFTGCKKDKTSSIAPKITSSEYIDNLLFVNQDFYQIQTNIPATFSSTDTHINITNSGTITMMSSGEIVPIDITWSNSKYPKTTIYALGATDKNQDAPAKYFHGEFATDPYNNYVQGWKTLQKLAITGETYGIVLRHADASFGNDWNVIHTGTPPANWWKSTDSLYARQLNPQGIQRATELGQIFKDLNYPIKRVISSEYYRAIQTAMIINAGPTINIDARINHPTHNTYAPGLFNGMLAIMHAQPIDNQMTLIVSHHPINEPLLTNGYPTFPTVAAFNWTGAYFVKVASDTTITYQGSASWAMFKYWRDLKLHKL